MMKKILPAILLAMILMPLVTYCGENTESTTNAEKTEKTNTATQAEKTVKNEKPLYWIDTMEPDIHYSKPGKSRMGMELVPVYPKDKK